MNNETKASWDQPSSEHKQAYQKPILTVIGELRTFTLSPSPVPTEESNPSNSNGRDTFPDGIEDQFEGRSSRQTDPSSGGRSGRG